MPQFFATTAKAMEDLLVDELRSLGIQKVQKTRAGAQFDGDLEDAYRVCLHSRIANRVLLPLRSFSAPTPEKLYAGVKAIRWSDHLSVDRTFAVDFQSSRSFITHTQFGALKSKDAIVDQFRSNTGERPSVNTENPDIRINIYLNDNEATVGIDLSGESLHRRGYRIEDTGAPLKENLAAAILMHADWPRHAARGAALIDPMCGSGTLPLEAALMASKTAPGLTRKKFGFSNWKGHQPAVWKKLVDEALDQELDEEMLSRLGPIHGYDQDFRAIRTALANSERAGLTTRTHFEKRELSATLALESRAREAPFGIVVMNPPYGERLGDEDELRDLYGRIGDTLKQRFKGWEAYILTSSPELAKCVGLKASRRIVLYNGALECRLLKFELY